jgi:1-deoxy-D-xylulose-5-phosphate synthase
MLIHDIALQNLHAIFAVDRAGLVGDDGDTHHGVFDVAYFSSIPNMTMLAPSSFAELREMLPQALYDVHGPVAIRYPRGGENNYSASNGKEPSVILHPGSDITIVSYGTMIGEVLRATEMLQEQGVSAEIVKLNRIIPVDIEPIVNSVAHTGRLMIAEECSALGCIGQQIAAKLAEKGSVPEKVILCNLGSGFVTHGTVPQLRQYMEIDSKSICRKALEVCRHG